MGTKAGRDGEGAEFSMGSPKGGWEWRRVTEERDRLKKEAEGINRERKLKQESAGRELQALEEKWMAHVKQNAEIQNACLALEAEIAVLQSTLKERWGEFVPLSRVPFVPLSHATKGQVAIH